MSLGDRMKAWRAAQRERLGGMENLSIWMPKRHAPFLKKIFEKLADPGSRGDDYRLAVSSWLRSRRAPAYVFSGTNFSCEIDLPFLGPHWHMRPAGGRVYGSYETWVEMTPNEADELKLVLKSAVSSKLEEWLRERELLGKLVDHVGVTLHPDFAQPGYRPRDGDSLHRPLGDEAFENNEAKIAREVEREAHQSRLHPTDDPTVVYYDGAWNIPSRCHAIHGRYDNRILFALVHIPFGGTSPTNMIEDLSAEMWKRFYPAEKFYAIDWFDCHTMPFDEKTVSINLVDLRDGSPSWSFADVDNLPPDFVAAINDAVRRDQEIADADTPARVRAR